MRVARRADRYRGGADAVCGAASMRNAIHRTIRTTGHGDEVPGTLGSKLFAV
jgi:hypothetical protein